MTLIEFFDKDAINNVCFSLVKKPERVVFVGDKLKAMEQSARRCHALLAEKGVNVHFSCRVVNKNNIRTIVNRLSEIIEQYDDCVFEVGGGEDLYLVAIGIVFQKYQMGSAPGIRGESFFSKLKSLFQSDPQSVPEKRVQLCRFNLRDNTIIDLNLNEQTTPQKDALRISVEELISIYGGAIVYEEQKKGTTYRWILTPKFVNDVKSMWDICRSDVQLWNTQINVIEAAASLNRSKDSLKTSVSMDALNAELRRRQLKYVAVHSIFSRLSQKGLLTSYECADDRFSVEFKDEQVKRCLTSSGQVLELIVYFVMKAVKNDDKTPTYDDVMTGVHIDWDGVIHTKRGDYDTENEIDVIATRGATPIFVSCKNGAVEPDELYKLEAVATRFGGSNARKILVATALGRSSGDNYLRQRAADMGIRIVESRNENGTRLRLVDLNIEQMKNVFRSL